MVVILAVMSLVILSVVLLTPGKMSDGQFRPRAKRESFLVQMALAARQLSLYFDREQKEAAVF